MPRYQRPEGRPCSISLDRDRPYDMRSRIFPPTYDLDGGARSQTVRGCSRTFAGCGDRSQAVPGGPTVECAACIEARSGVVVCVVLEQSVPPRCRPRSCSCVRRPDPEPPLRSYAGVEPFCSLDLSCPASGAAKIVGPTDIPRLGSQLTADPTPPASVQATRPARSFARLRRDLPIMSPLDKSGRMSSRPVQSVATGLPGRRDRRGQ